MNAKGINNVICNLFMSLVFHEKMSLIISKQTCSKKRGLLSVLAEPLGETVGFLWSMPKTNPDYALSLISYICVCHMKIMSSHAFDECLAYMAQTKVLLWLLSPGYGCHCPLSMKNQEYHNIYNKANILYF